MRINKTWFKARFRRDELHEKAKAVMTEFQAQNDHAAPALTDVAIVGGGFAGCMAAIALGRAGHKVTVIDINDMIPSLFRAEKISSDQLPLLQQLGLLEDFKAVSTPVTKFVNIRGNNIFKRPTVEEYGFLYPTVVELLRRRLPSNVELKIGRVSDIKLTDDMQHVVLANGETIAARLVVLATGYGEALRRKLGFERRQNHPLQTVCAGFSLKAPAAGFRFSGLAAYGERPGDGVDYIAFFPLDDMVRANLFMFTDIRDPRIVALRNEGLPALFNMLPGLRPWIEGAEVVGDVSVFPVELYSYEKVVRSGIVLIGDAFRTSCPAVGSGLSCSMVDVIRLRDHVASWFKTAGMDATKIAAFYSDPVKVARDNEACSEAFRRRNAIFGSSSRNRLWLAAYYVIRGLRDRLYASLYHAGLEKKYVRKSTVF